jgi:hypothetical protein
MRFDGVMKNFNSSDWERSVIRELKRDHDHIGRTHKVFLRPIHITLFDSDTRWGKFDPLTWTIFLSRRLVEKFSWYQVLGVFRHEVAHQYVAEKSPLLGADVQAHGPEFREACKRIGVPDQYARFDLDLTTCDLDWRNEKRSDDSEKIIEKVRKLLALANSTNEHEALLAMQRVREIYAKYNLEQIEKSAKEGFVHLVVTRGKKRVEIWEMKIASLLTKFFFVEIVLSREFDAKSGDQHQSMELIGTRENVLMAEYVYHFLLNQLQQLLSQSARADRKFSRREYNSYRLGILMGFETKLEKAEKQSPSSTDFEPAVTVVGKAITAFRDDPRLRDYLGEIYPRLVSRRAGKIALVDHAFSAGRAVGVKLTLNKPISSAPTNSGRTLTGGRG